MAPYRPPGRSNRSGRSQADYDVFEGLPVKQWNNIPTRISLAPPSSETVGQQSHDRWGEPPMPRDFHLLQPFTQQLLRLARSGQIGQKRKSVREADDAEGEEYGAREDDGANGDEANGATKLNGDDRAFVAKKWRSVPEHALVPEHLHWEFLAKRRKGLPNFYHHLNGDVIAVSVPTRKAKVQKVLDTATGETAVYEVLVPEGQTVEGEITEESELASAEPLSLPAGTVVDGLGVANDDGVLVVEVRNPTAVAQRRNRPPPKKKGGPGRGKKRVTFTNPDGSTYTRIVPNATKIVPEPGQTVKHVAKGEEAAKDVSAEEAATLAKDPNANEGGEGDEEGDDDDDEEGDDDGDDDDDREEGELVDEEAEASTGENLKPETSTTTTAAAAAAAEPETNVTDVEVQDNAQPPTASDTSKHEDSAILDVGTTDTEALDVEEPPARDATSSPDVPLAQNSANHSRQNSAIVTPDLKSPTHTPEVLAELIEPSDTVPPDHASEAADPDTTAAASIPAEEVVEAESDATASAPVETAADGEEDLLGSLERHLEADGK